VKAYNDFGVKCARMGLWNEAIMRWKHVVEMDPDNAQAHNNLGVAYESKGEFDTAMAEYKMATELDPDNKTYIKNYTRFRRNYERASERKKTQEQKTKAQNSELTT
jgi:Flp pilus assembly protein TadD